MGSTGSENGVYVMKNVNFDHAADPPRTGILTAAGDLIIGTGATDPSPEALKGVLTSPDGSVTFGYSSPNITAVVSGGTTSVTRLKPDANFDGTAAVSIAPQAGIINIRSYNPSVATVTDTLNSTGLATGDLKIEHRAWQTQFVVDTTANSAVIGRRGTYSTIQAAIDAASAGDTIFIRNGAYTENLTLKSQVHLQAFNVNQYGDGVSITGKMTYAGANTVGLSGLTFYTNSDYLLTTSSGTVRFNNCNIQASNNTAIQNTGGTVTLWSCRYTTTSTFALISQSSGSFQILFTTGTSSSPNATTTFSGGSLLMQFSQITEPMVLTNAATAQSFYCRFPHNRTVMDCQNTSYFECWYSQLNTGSQDAVKIAAGAQADLWNTNLNTSTANYAVSGTGVFEYDSLTFSNTNFAIDPGLATVRPRTFANQAVMVKTPGAYPYTAKPQDYVILVDTSAARTINLNASPRTGQVYRIKDNVGSAAANNITITPAAGNIDGAGSATINVAYGSMDVCYQGSMWIIL